MVVGGRSKAVANRQQNTGAIAAHFSVLGSEPSFGCGWGNPLDAKGDAMNDTPARHWCYRVPLSILAIVQGC